MRSLLLPSAAVLGAAMLFAPGLGLGATGATKGTALSSTLAARGETPAPNGAARAQGVFTATLSGRSLTWRLAFSRLTGPAVAAHVHLGKPGVAGPVEIALCGPCRSGMTGSATVSAKARKALLAGTAYVNVHTARNQGGEVRGQIGIAFTTALSAEDETPAPAGAARARGVFTASLAGRTLSWRLAFSRLTGPAVAAHVHLGKPGVAGPVEIALCGPCRSGMTGSATVSAKARKALLAGTAYVNVHTARNQGGEIRGQLDDRAKASPASATTTTTETDTTPADDPGGSGGYG